MKKQSIKKNYLYNLIYQILAIILPIITTPYLARVLGPNGTGTYSYTISIVTYFILFGSLGLNLYGQREIAYVQNDNNKINKIFSELIILKFITLTISMIIFYLLFCINNNYSIYYKILLLEIIANIVDIGWLYQGLEDFKRIVFRNIVIKFISIISIFIFIKTKSDTWKYTLIYVSTTLVGNLSLWFKSSKYANFKVKKLNIVRHIKPTLILFIPQIAIQIYTVLDKTMIGYILKDVNEVGYYEQSQKIIRVLLTVITSLGTVMLPRIAKCYADGNNKQIKKYMDTTFNFIYFLAFPIIFGIIATSKNFVPLFFGDGYEKVSTIMSIMSAIILFIGLSNVTGTQYLLPTKRQKEYTISVIIGSIINLILNIIFIGKLKSIGATAATVIAELSVTLVQFYYVRKDFDLNKIIELSFKYFISGLIMLIICLLIDKIILSNFTGIMLQIVMGTITYIVMLVILKDKFLLNIINSYILPRIKKN